MNRRTGTDDTTVLDEIYQHSAIAEQEFICKKCGNIISEGESYFENEDMVKELILRFFAEQVKAGIQCCTLFGDGADIQSLYGSVKSCFYDAEDNPGEIFNDLDTASTLEDLLNDWFSERADEWMPYYDDIAAEISCPVCGNGSGSNYEEKIDYGTFDSCTEVYTSQDIDRFNHDFYGDLIEPVKIEISDLARAVSFDELKMLKNDYIKNKTFTAQNPSFTKLESCIITLYNMKKYYLLSPNRIIYRTRPSKAGESLKKEQMWEHPYNVASHGRYNDVGSTLLYCANNSDIIKQEVSISAGQAYNIAKFMVCKSFRLFPINFIFDGDFEGLISETVPEEQQKDAFKEQYILSNIVAAICSHVGFDGIVYRSTKDNHSIDYAIFCKFEKSRDIIIIEVTQENN